MKITVKELDAMYRYIAKSLTKSGYKEIDLDDEDYYWHVGTGDRFKMEKPKSLCVGSIIDDWNSLKEDMLEEDIMNFDIERFAHILIAIQEKIEKDGQCLIPG